LESTKLLPQRFSCFTKPKNIKQINKAKIEAHLLHKLQAAAGRLNLCGEAKMFERRRIGIAIDRRTGFDRRKVYDLDYFPGGGIERRMGHERRSLEERRSGWTSVSQGCSVFVGDLKRISPGKIPT
jgi:hypothetical protein